jgi:hypothetical protein
MSGLDDLNTEPAVRRALRDSYGHWIREVGVDAFRVDTAFYVPPALLRRLPARRRPGRAGHRAGGARDRARRLPQLRRGLRHRPPFRATCARKIEAYMRAPPTDGMRLPGMLNFPLYGSLGDVFARGAPTAELARASRR